MMPPSIELPEELDERLTAISVETGRNKADVIIEALAEHLDDIADLAIAERRYAEFLAGGQRAIPLEDILRRY